MTDKSVNVDVQMIATASLNKSVAQDLTKPDKDMKEVLNENTKRDDGKGSTGNNPDSDK